MLARQVGQKKAKEIWFLCRQYDAEQAARMGLVNTVVPLEALEEETVGWCREMLALSPFALRLLKAGFHADEDGLAGIQQLAHDANLLFYGDRRRRRAGTRSSRSGARSSSASPSAREHLGRRGPAPHAAGRGRPRARRARPARSGEVPGGLIWWRAACALVVALAIQVAHQLRQRLQRRHPRHRRDEQPGRAGAAGRPGPGRAGGGEAGRVRRRSAWPAVAGLALALAVGPELLVVGARVVRSPAGSTPAARGPTATPGSARCSCSCSSALVATAGRPTCRPRTLDRAGAGGASVPVGLLATALLVVNNLRDIPGDTAVGQAHAGGAPRRRRRPGSSTSALLVGAFVAVPLVAGLGGRPAGALALIAVVLAQKPVTAVLRRRPGPALIPVLGATGRVQLVFGVLFAVGLAISA